MLLSLRAPAPARVRALLAAFADAPFTYAAVGATRELPVRVPRGFTLDEARCELGRGARTFAAGADALRAWRMFELGWVRMCWSTTPIRAGAVVAVATRHLGLWALNPCRIVSVIDEPRRFGFAYGTLPGHAEAGEELFTIERDDDGVVHYAIRAISRPHALLARCARPYVRMLQARFRRDSLAAMRRAVTAASGH